VTGSPAKIRFGSTTYSFNAEYHSYEYSLEDVFAMIGALGSQQGVELIGPQCIRGFPEVSEEFERSFRRWVEKYELVPSAFGHYSDLGRISDRDLTLEEAVSYSRVQLEGAKRLGFSLARFSYLSFDLTDRSKALYRLLLPDAERLGIRLAMEIHSPHIIESEAQRRVIDDVMSLNSPFVGFTLDCGTMTSRVSPLCVQKFLDQGVGEDIVGRILQMWEQRCTREELELAVEALGGGPLAELFALESWVYFGHGDPRAMRDLMPFIFHVHGKFYHVDDSGQDDAVRYPEIIGALVEGGYQGWISTEYEGHHWLSGVHAFRQTQAHQHLLRGLIASSEKRLSAAPPSR
jgi:sugar phosphate isomerase/epimerase